MIDYWYECYFKIRWNSVESPFKAPLPSVFLYADKKMLQLLGNDCLLSYSAYCTIPKQL